MQILNSPDFLRDYPKQLEQSMYGIFAIFRDKGSNVLSVGFGGDRHVSLRRKMEEGDREMIGGGVITHQNGEYKMIGRTSNNKEYPELDFEFMQSIAGQVCDVLGTNVISIPREGELVKITKDTKYPAVLVGDQ